MIDRPIGMSSRIKSAMAVSTPIQTQRLASAAHTTPNTNSAAIGTF